MIKNSKNQSRGCCVAPAVSNVKYRLTTFGLGLGEQIVNTHCQSLNDNFSPHSTINILSTILLLISTPSRRDCLLDSRLRAIRKSPPLITIPPDTYATPHQILRSPSTFHRPWGAQALQGIAPISGSSLLLVIESLCGLWVRFNPVFTAWSAFSKHYVATRPPGHQSIIIIRHVSISVSQRWLQQ